MARDIPIGPYPQPRSNTLPSKFGIEFMRRLEPKSILFFENTPASVVNFRVCFPRT